MIARNVAGGGRRIGYTASKSGQLDVRVLRTQAIRPIAPRSGDRWGRDEMDDDARAAIDRLASRVKAQSETLWGLLIESHQDLKAFGWAGR